MANKKVAKNVLYGFHRNTNGATVTKKKELPKRTNGIVARVKKK